MDALLEISRILSVLSMMTLLGIMTIGVFGIIGWGLVELTIELFTEPPGEGITFVPSPLSDILMRSFKEDLADLSRRPTQVPGRQQDSDRKTTWDPTGHSPPPG